MRELTTLQVRAIRTYCKHNALSYAEHKKCVLGIESGKYAAQREIEGAHSSFWSEVLFFKPSLPSTRI